MIQELCNEQDKWISVKDSLPELLEYVLVNIGSDTVLVGRRYGNGWCVIFSDGVSFVTTEGRQVTHWQPLPNPPKQ